MNQNQNPPPTSTPPKGKASSTSKAKKPAEKKPPTAEEIKAAATVLSLALVQAGADDSLPAEDISVSYDITLRIGKGEPYRITAERTIHGALEPGDLASAPEEFETTLRQILTPLQKQVKRAVTEKMNEVGDSPPGIGFVKTIGQ